MPLRPIPKAPRRDRRIALQPSNVADRHEPHAVAAFGQDTRRHEAVAAIVAGACHDHDPAPGAVTRGHRSGDRPARLFHEVDAGHAAGYRQTIGLAHLGVRQQLDHAATRFTKSR